MSNDAIIEELVRRMGTLEAETKRLASLKTLFTILNENTPAQITSTQNDYNPGDYDSLRLSADAARTITGISGGVTGRVLRLVIVGSFSITLAHESASSAAENRIRTPAGVDLVFSASATSAGALLYYDSTTERWRVLSYEL